MKQAQSPGNGMGRGDAEINGAVEVSTPIIPRPTGKAAAG
jgi:hypothetical protein